MSEEAEDIEIVVAATQAELKDLLGWWISHLTELEVELIKAREIAAPFEGMVVDSNVPNLKAARRLIQELPPKIEAAERQIEQFRTRLADLLIEEARAQRDGRDFWFRRFMVSLQIGNGAAFLAAVAGLLQADASELPQVAKLIWHPALFFGLGVTAAGVLPWAMVGEYNEDRRWAKKAKYWAVGLSSASVAFFATGMLSVLVEIHQLKRADPMAIAGGVMTKTPPAAPAVQGKGVRTQAAGTESKPQAPPANNQQAPAPAVSEKASPATTPPAAPAPQDAPAPK